jgi:hypothetical protein
VAHIRQPDTARRWGGVAAVAVVAVAAAAGAGACYKPNIVDGGLLCAEAGKLCPDGYTCDRATNTCRRPGSIADAHQDGPMDVGKADAMTDARPDAMEVACYTPVAGCTPQVTNGCDPVCQTKCGCREKCSVSAAGVVGCTVPLPGNAGPYAPCEITVAAGDSPQTDACAPGLVCVNDRCGARCYPFCRVDADCPGSTCTGNAGGGVKICAVKFASCDPVGTQARSSCSVQNQACYLASTVPDRTICDCTGPQGAEGANCATNFECVAGLVCVDSAGAGQLMCRRLCRLSQDAGVADGGASQDAGAPGSGCDVCPTGNSKPLVGSAVYGYCY